MSAYSPYGSETNTAPTCPPSNLGGLFLCRPSLPGISASIATGNDARPGLSRQEHDWFDTEAAAKDARFDMLMQKSKRGYDGDTNSPEGQDGGGELFKLQ